MWIVPSSLIAAFEHVSQWEVGHFSSRKFFPLDLSVQLLEGRLWAGEGRGGAAQFAKRARIRPVVRGGRMSREAGLPAPLLPCPHVAFASRRAACLLCWHSSLRVSRDSVHLCVQRASYGLFPAQDLRCPRVPTTHVSTQPCTVLCSWWVRRSRSSASQLQKPRGSRSSLEAAPRKLGATAGQPGGRCLWAVNLEQKDPGRGRGLRSFLWLWSSNQPSVALIFFCGFYFTEVLNFLDSRINTSVSSWCSTNTLSFFFFFFE